MIQYLGTKYQLTRHEQRAATHPEAVGSTAEAPDLIYTLGRRLHMDQLLQQSSLYLERSTPKAKPKEYCQSTVPVLFSSLFLCWP